MRWKIMLKCIADEEQQPPYLTPLMLAYLRVVDDLSASLTQYIKHTLYAILLIIFGICHS